MKASKLAFARSQIYCWLVRKGLTLVRHVIM